MGTVALREGSPAPASPGEAGGSPMIIAPPLRKHPCSWNKPEQGCSARAGGGQAEAQAVELKVK